MFKIFRKEIIKFDSKRILNELRSLQNSEDEIHKLNESDYSNQNLDKIKEISKYRSKIILNLNNEFKLLENEILVLTNGKKVENKIHFVSIKEHLIGIEKILLKQLEDLKKTEILENKFLRTQAINGEKPEGDSKLTNLLKKTTDLITNESKIIARSIIETTKELNLDGLDEMVVEMKERVNVEERFEIRGDTIYDKETKLEWVRNLSKLEKMNWDDAIKLNKSGFQLPTLKEINTLNINQNESNFHISEGENSHIYPNSYTLKEIGFTGNVDIHFWTRTEENEGMAFVYDSNNGSIYGEIKTVDNYILYVRKN